MKNFILLFLASVTLLGCKKKSTSNCPEPDLNCGGISCLVYNYHFDFRLVDKTSGADLVFGTSPRYNASDIKLFSDAAKQIPVPVNVDNVNKLFVVTKAKTEMYLEVAVANTYKIIANFKKVDCCSERIKDLNMDNQSVCVCCNDAIELKVN